MYTTAISPAMSLTARRYSAIKAPQASPAVTFASGSQKSSFALGYILVGLLALAATAVTAWQMFTPAGQKSMAAQVKSNEIMGGMP